MVSSLLSRHCLPAFAAAGGAALAARYSYVAVKTVASGWPPLRGAALLGAISGIFYSATHDLLATKTALLPFWRHSIAILTSAVATYGAAFAAASAGLIAMPTLTTLGLLVAAAIASDMLWRAIFASPLPVKINLSPVPVPVPVNPPDPVPGPAPHQPGPLPKPGGSVWDQVTAPRRPSLQGACVWQADLSKIGLRTSSKQQIDEYVTSVLRENRTTGKLPTFHRKGERFNWGGKSWSLPRTVYFVTDPQTKKLSAVLLNTNKKDLAPLGKGANRTAKVCYNLLTGERLVKKRADSNDEVKLLKDVKGEGIEPLNHIVTVPDKRKSYTTKSHLITPLFDGTMKQLLDGTTPLSAKAVHGMALSLFRGLSRLHTLPGKPQVGVGRPYLSYHSDLKPSNLLYKRDSAGNYVAAISDMGTVNKVHELWATMGWMSPRKVQQWYGLVGKKNASDYNLQESQRDDVWGMGLILAALLQGRLNRDPRWKELVGLRCITQKCQFDDSGLANLRQSELDAEIGELQRAVVRTTSDGAAKVAMWNIVKGMSQIDRTKRLNMQQALRELEKVVV